MAQPMPETVKWDEVHGLLATPSSKVGFPFHIKLAPDEVMVLLSMHWWWYGTMVAGVNAATMALWRKTDSNPPGSIYEEGDSQDMIWSFKDSRVFVTESIIASDHEHMTFPWPIILIRPPRMVITTSLMTNAVFSVRLYYLLREINDTDLAKLMVKDHA